MTIKAFSLIELLVVIAIVGVLAAIAVPIYMQYSVKARLGVVVSQLMSLAESPMVKFQTSSSFPSTITVNGQTVGGGWVNVSVGNIKYLLYSPNNSARSALLVGSISGLTGIPGYAAPAGTTSQSYDQLAVGIRQMDDGTIKTVCGSWSYSSYPSYYVPSSYLPSNCACPEVSSFISGNIVPGC